MTDAQKQDEPRRMFAIEVYNLGRHERPDQMLTHAAQVASQGITDARNAGGRVTEGVILGPHHEPQGRWAFAPAADQSR
jgi:hypothetical protein